MISKKGISQNTPEQMSQPQFEPRALFRNMREGNFILTLAFGMVSERRNRNEKLQCIILRIVLQGAISPRPDRMQKSDPS
jgi:hypothetical protein